MKKLFVGTPAYDGKVNAQFAVSLAQTHTYLASKGLEVVFQINCSGSLLVAERNRLVQAFLSTDCTHCLFIDSDLGWPHEAVESMLNKDVDFIAGVYPTRKEQSFLFRPSYNPDQSVIRRADGLLKMEAVPAGFIMIKREAMIKILEAHPELIFQPKDKSIPPSNCIFNTEVIDGEFWGEDYVFCKRAGEAGIDIWVDPVIEFDHCGVRGMLLSVLTDKKPT